MQFALAAFAGNLAVTALTTALVVAVAFTVGRMQGRHSVIDAAWGLGFAAVAAATLAWAALSGHGVTARAWLAAALTMVWGVRLGGYIAYRSRGKGEDPRYAELMRKAPGNPTWYAVRSIYLLQGAVLWLVSMPVQVAAYIPAPLGWPAALGAAVWLVGLAFESIGDAQLARFKSDPANRGRIMDRGLWAWTRHPNYFGDACVWWGLFLIAAGAWPGILTVYAPIAMTLLLTKGSGKRILEARMADRPGYAEYRERTSGFVPWPPRRPLHK